MPSVPRGMSGFSLHHKVHLKIGKNRKKLRKLSRTFMPSPPVTVLISASLILAPTGTSPDVRNRTPGRRTRSEEHTSELQSLMRISYAVFCLKKKKQKTKKHNTT